MPLKFHPEGLSCRFHRRLISSSSRVVVKSRRRRRRRCRRRHHPGSLGERHVNGSDGGAPPNGMCEKKCEKILARGGWESRAPRCAAASLKKDRVGLPPAVCPSYSEYCGFAPLTAIRENTPASACGFTQVQLISCVWMKLAPTSGGGAGTVHLFAF